MNSKSLLLVSNLMAISFGIVSCGFGLMAAEGPAWAHLFTLMGLFGAFLGTIGILFMSDGCKMDKTIPYNVPESVADKDYETEGGYHVDPNVSWEITLDPGNVIFDPEDETMDSPGDVPRLPDEMDDAAYVKNVMAGHYKKDTTAGFDCRLCQRHFGKRVTFDRRNALIRHFLTQKEGHYQAVIDVGEGAFEGEYWRRFNKLMDSEVVQNYLQRRKLN